MINTYWPGKPSNDRLGRVDDNRTSILLMGLKWKVGTPPPVTGELCGVIQPDGKATSGPQAENLCLPRVIGKRIRVDTAE